MTNTAHSTDSAQAAILAPWPVFAAEYRAALNVYLDASNGTDDDVAEDANDKHGPRYLALIAYPVQTVEQLAEKAELIALDCWDESAAFKVVTADAKRIAGVSAPVVPDFRS